MPYERMYESGTKCLQISRSKLFEEFLSTFKFESGSAIDTSGWKTYRNEKFGFEFKYPDPWQFDARSRLRVSFETRGNVIFYSIEQQTPMPLMEIFSKGSNESLKDAIKRTILADYPSDYCQILDQTKDRSQFSAWGFEVAQIYDSDPKNNLGPSPHINNCNLKYGQKNTPGQFFIYDPRSPGKSIFYVSDGQSGLLSEIIPTFSQPSHYQI